MKKLMLINFVLTFVFSVNAQQKDFPKLSGPYLGQISSGDEFEIFARGILPSSNYHTTPVFSPDGKEVYWKMQGNNTISMMKIENGVWTPPAEITLSSKLDDFRDPCISPDGKKIFFLSKGKLPHQQKDKENIWFAERISGGWGEPQPLGEEINSHELHWQVSVASNGNLYFTSRNTGVGDIYCARYINDKYQKPERLGNMINMENLSETTPFIAPDESYLIFSRNKNETQQPYICFRGKDGIWGLPKEIEQIKYCLCPQVSPDGKYFFFMSWYNGECVIYWVSASIIEELESEK
jgi:Tol biopolymer transport system component